MLQNTFNLAQSGFLGTYFGVNFESVASIIALIIFFGFCIFIHELGHFLAAKWRGLHVIAFSIGFRKIWSKKWRGVEYRIGWLPFGGYVDLPQIDSSDDQPVDENNNPLPRASALDRILVAMAGPLCNILFGFVIGIFIWTYGLPAITAPMDQVTVTSLSAGSPEYKAGLRNGDVITKINGKTFQMDWEDFVQEIIFHNGSISFDVLKPDGTDTQITYTPIPNKVRAPSETVAYPFFECKAPAVINPIPGQIAEKAGLKKMDVITAIQLADKPKINIGDRNEFINALSRIDTIQGAAIADTLPCKVWVRRNRVNLEKPFEMNLERQPISMSLGMNLLNTQMPVIADAGDHPVLKKGDIILTINGAFPKTFQDVRSLLISENPDSKTLVKLSLLRGEKRINVDLFPYPCENMAGLPLTIRFAPGIRTAGVDQATRAIGIQKDAYILNTNIFDHVWSSDTPEMLVALNPDADECDTFTVIPKTKYMMYVDLFGVKYPTPWKQFTNTISSTVRMIKGMFNPDATISATNMAGPIGIVDFAQKVAKKDLMSAIHLLAVVSFSLGIFNLFPFPVLDGGHIVFGLIEVMRRKPIPSKVLKPIMMGCVMLLILLMIFVTGLDAFRVKNNFDTKPNDPFQTQLLVKLP